MPNSEIIILFLLCSYPMLGETIVRHSISIVLRPCWSVWSGESRENRHGYDGGWQLASKGLRGVNFEINASHYERNSDTDT